MEETYLDIRHLYSLCQDPDFLIEKFGLGKVFTVRKFIILYKNILKYYFIHSPREVVEELLKGLNMDYHDYIVLVINKIRRILKCPRYLKMTRDELRSVTTNEYESKRFFSSLAGLGIMLISDLDGVITAKGPRETLREIIELSEPKNLVILTGSGKPVEEVKRILKNNGFDPMGWQIISVKGKVKKVKQLKTISMRAVNPLILYFDDEEEYLRYSSFLLMLSYRVERSGKIRRYPPMK